MPILDPDDDSFQKCEEEYDTDVCPICLGYGYLYILNEDGEWEDEDCWKCEGLGII